MITFERVPTKFDWEIKRWHIKAGKYYLGTLYKRYIGPGTPLYTGKPKREKVYMAHLNISKAEGTSTGLPRGNRPDIKKFSEIKILIIKSLQHYAKTIQSE